MIIKVTKGINSKNVIYKTKLTEDKKIINKVLHQKLWDFDNDTIDKELKLFDYFNFSVSIATLCNKAFIIKDYTEDINYVYIDKFKLEKKILKNAISGRNQCFNYKEKIIFPYKYKKGELIRYSENEIIEKFPFAYEFLCHNKNDLLKRTSDKSAKWFEYGRSQALKHLNQDKLFVSSVITNQVRVYDLGKNDIPYSGIYITKK